MCMCMCVCDFFFFFRETQSRRNLDAFVSISSFNNDFTTRNSTRCSFHPHTVPSKLSNLSPIILMVLLGDLFRVSVLKKKSIRNESLKYQNVMLIVLTLFLDRAYRIVRYNDVQALVSLEKSASRKELIQFDATLSKGLLSIGTSIYKSICEPVFFGMENIPNLEDGPLLFVSNHSILALELPLLINHLAEEKGIFLRALADHAHFQIPTGRFLRTMFGVVDGNKDNAKLLFQQNQAVLVYPGGARETFKRTTDEKYALKWEGKSGFAKIAIENGVTIVPISNVGTEDMLEIGYDFPLSWVPIPFLYGSDRTLPLVMPPQIGKLQRIYFRFHKPIRTKQYNGIVSEENISLVRDRTKKCVEDGIAKLRDYQQTDRSRLTIDKYSRNTKKRLKALVDWIGTVQSQGSEAWRRGGKL